MRIPAIHGIIDRRILVNYRVDPQAIERLLPPPFCPKLLRGHAIAGICLIRLRDIRPKFLPLPCGIRSENAAHRIAVKWEADGLRKEGVFIPRRDTDSRLNALAGGRLFPGEHHHARFDVRETANHLSVQLHSDDGDTHVAMEARPAADLPDSSIFQSLDEASAFFEAGSIGYSATTDPARFDGLELRCTKWHIEPLDVHHVSSTFFENRETFPTGSAAFDCALLMRDIAHEWRAMDELCCATGHSGASAIAQPAA